MIAFLAPPWSTLPTDGLASGNDHLIQDVATALAPVSDVVVFCLGDSPSRGEEASPYRRLTVPGTERGWFNDRGALDAYAKHAVDQAHELGVRLMIVMQPSELVEAVRGHAPQFACALVASSHHLYREDNYYGYGSLSSSEARKAVEAADVVVALSTFLADRIGEQHPGASSKIVVAPQGVNGAFFTPRVSRPAAPRVVYVGRLDRAKGVHILLAAFNEITGRYPDASLTIAGDYFGPEQGAYRAEIAPTLAQAGERVTLLGWVRRGSLPAVYSSGDIFVHPAVWDEPFASTVLEAMAAGLPIVATRSGGTPEAIADGDSGLLVPPSDVGALARALGRLASDPQLSANVGRAAQRRAAKSYTWRGFVDTLLALANAQLR